MTSEVEIGLAPSPAPFNDKVLSVIREVIHPLAVTTILDPFAGTGRIHELRPRYQTYGIEVEPEWAHHKSYVEKGWTEIADCVDIMEAMANGVPIPDGWPARFDAIVTSPTYGNRMADHHEAKDDSSRTTYKHKLGRDLTENNSGAMHWGEEYRALHQQAWKWATELVSDGYFVLNMKDHFKTFKKGEPPVRQYVTLWHIEALKDLGWRVLDHREVPTRGNRFGANGHLRVAYETVTLMEKS